VADDPTDPIETALAELDLFAHDLDVPDWWTTGPRSHDTDY
jgi:hypothetical protein